MAEYSNRLDLPYIMASQAQKHVTHNDAIRLLDGMVQASVINATTSTPPASPSDGDCYIVAATATDEWAGWEDDIAMWADGAWYRLPRATGYRVWDQSADELLVYYSGSWSTFSAALGGLAQAPSVDVSKAASGATTGLSTLGETLSGLSGPTVTSSIVIPDRSICLGVSVKTTTSITGATSFDCGISGEVSKFGGSLGIASGSTNKGVISPEAFYSDTPVVLTANGSDFTGGAVEIAIHLLTVGAPV